MTRKAVIVTDNCASTKQDELLRSSYDAGFSS